MRLWVGSSRSNVLPNIGLQLTKPRCRSASQLKPATLAATSLLDLRVPPANRLEKLAGDRAGQHSIRINDQWRLCFRWLGTDAHDVEIVDYH